MIINTQYINYQNIHMLLAIHFELSIIVLVGGTQ